jgi:signal transduction histidine kinase
LTGRKIAEENVINLNTERRLKWQLKSVLEHIKDAVIVFSQDGKLLDANAAAREFWELSENSYGKGYTEIYSRFKYYSLDNRELPIDLQPVPLAFSGQEYKNLELRVLNPDKQLEQYLSYSAAGVHDEKGITRLIVVSIHDITGRKKNEFELQQAKWLAEQKATELASVNKELEAFSYSVSHDLRTPINSVIGFSRILYEDYSDVLDEEGKSMVIRIINSGLRMNELIDDMLSLSKVSRQEIQRTVINLSKLAEDYIAELMESDPERNITIFIQPSMIISGDEKLIKMALQNLLRNSWKFSSKTPDAHIEMGSFIENKENIFFVRDNGAGFDMKFAERLFVPFKRLHSDNEFPGTGIGLAIVERVIKRHGGRIWAQGSPGKGATFFFTL